MIKKKPQTKTAAKSVPAAAKTTTKSAPAKSTTKSKAAPAKESKDALKKRLSGLSYNDLKKVSKEEFGIKAIGNREQIIAKILGEEVPESVPTAKAAKSTKSVSKKTSSKDEDDEDEDEDSDEEDSDEDGEEDEEDDGDGLDDLSQEELANICSDNGLSVKGKKQSLIDRIRKAVEEGKFTLDDGGDGDDDDDEEDDEDEGEEDGDEDGDEEEFDIADLAHDDLVALAKKLKIKTSTKVKGKTVNLSDEDLADAIADGAEDDDIISALTELGLLADGEEDDSDEDDEEEEDEDSDEEEEEEEEDSDDDGDEEDEEVDVDSYIEKLNLKEAKALLREVDTKALLAALIAKGYIEAPEEGTSEEVEEIDVAAALEDIDDSDIKSIASELGIPTKKKTIAALKELIAADDNAVSVLSEMGFIDGDEFIPSKERLNVEDGIEKKIKAQYKAGKLKPTAVANFNKSHYNGDPDCKGGCKNCDEDTKLACYISIKQKFVDDDAELHEDKEMYVRDGVYYCCGEPLADDGAGNFICGICGTSYEAPEDAE